MTFMLDAFAGKVKWQLYDDCHRLLRACGHREHLLKVVISHAPEVMEVIPETERRELVAMLGMDET